MRVALFNVVNKNKKGAANKDLAGGMGTRSNFGNSFLAKLVGLVKEQSIRLPIVSFAFLRAIFKEKGHKVYYIEGDNIDGEYDLVLIYGSIVDFRYENAIAEKTKNRHPGTKIGFFGSFPSVRPDLFESCDFVIRGEAESFFLYEFQNLENLKGVTGVKNILNLDDLPTPDFDGFPIKTYSYFPAIKEKPFLVLQASKGCPYSCFYYCPYGMIQGQQYRIRSAEKLVEDVLSLVNKYKIKGLQFRDPTFGIDKEQVKKFCNLLLQKKIKIKFGVETRLDLLDKELLDLMFKAGLRNINVGVETAAENVARLNNRTLIQIKHQEEIIDYCERLGIKVSAFYIIGLLGDTEDSVKKTIECAIKLNTNIAQFTISCPYPGTKYYDELKSKNAITEEDFEKFDSSHVVFRHNKLSPAQLLELREGAFKKYYFRFGYLINFLKWRIREFWL